MKNVQCMAFDCGASNGRVILGRFDGRKLLLEELHRFSNDPVVSFDGMQWDILKIFSECTKALGAFVAQSDEPLLSVGIDSWGTDFGLLDRNGHLISNPYHYRDRRMEGIIERVSGTLDAKSLFALTGNASIKYNTVYQLLAMRPAQSTLLDNAHTMLLIPDLLAYLLTGERATEYTNATTTQLMSPNRDTWSEEVIRAFDLPFGMLPYIIQPGTRIGGICPKVRQSLQLPEIHVAATATHDTASAVSAIPDLDEDTAFISSGTWSLIGVETARPVINDSVFEARYSNEGGIDGKNLLLRNTVGMWILQECVREWEASGKALSYGRLIGEAQVLANFGAWIDPDDDAFAYPGRMPEKIREYCVKTGQKPPRTNAELVRCVVESMALKYRWCFDNIERIVGRRLKALHIVGGGSQNAMLNQFTANVIDRPVICGPVEATATGNILIQLKLFGEIASLNELRQVVRDSFELIRYEPKDTQSWDDAYHRYLNITQNSK